MQVKSEAKEATPSMLKTMGEKQGWVFMLFVVAAEAAHSINSI